MKNLKLTANELNAHLADLELWSVFENVERTEFDASAVGVNYSAGNPIGVETTENVEIVAHIEGRTVAIATEVVTREVGGKVKVVAKKLNLRGVDLFGTPRTEDGSPIFEWRLIEDGVIKHPAFEKYKK